MTVFLNLRQTNCCSHAKFVIDANHVIKKDSVAAGKAQAQFEIYLFYLDNKLLVL